MESWMNKAGRGDQTVQFGDFALDLSTAELSSNGRPVKLQRQPAQVLALLASRPGQVVTRAEIRECLWEQDTHVDFEQGINWCIRRIRQVVGDDVASPRFVETVAKQGYRFIAPVSQVAPVATTKRSTWVRGLQLAAVALAVAISIGPLTKTAAADRVLVLPLDNFSGTSAADGLAEARTDQLIAGLGAARPDRLRVIDRLTAAKFKRSGECIIKIGTKLNADYVFVGSVQQSGEGLRIAGGLFRVADNTQVWTTGEAGESATTDSGVARIKDAVLKALTTPADLSR
jgi:DNA-binding winged helix-turn-helix (wHTH) protein/TolB-like protein